MSQQNPLNNSKKLNVHQVRLNKDNQKFESVNQSLSGTDQKSTGKIVTNNQIINFKGLKISEVAKQARANSIRKSQPRSQTSIDDHTATQSSKLMKASNFPSNENNKHTNAQIHTQIQSTLKREQHNNSAQAQLSTF